MGQGHADRGLLTELWEWAKSSVPTSLGQVSEWNTASRRVLAKVGFTETERREVDEVYGTTLFTAEPL